ncbi:hypothetical protein [Bacillus safensis FO-36b] [Bacillus safensis subsp. safensis]
MQNGIDQNKKGVAAIKDEIKGAKKELMAEVAQVNQQVSLYKSISKELKAALAQVRQNSR